MAIAVHVEPFYRRHGYRPEGGHLEEAGIDHVRMRKPLDGRSRGAAGLPQGPAG